MESILLWMALLLRDNGLTIRKMAMGQGFGQDKRFTLANGVEIAWRATVI